MDNQEFFMRRIDSYYNWKLFSVMAAAFAAPTGLYYGFPVLNVSTMYFGAAPALVCLYALAGFAASIIAIKKLKRQPQNFQQILRIDRLHILGVYLTIAVLRFIEVITVHRQFDKKLVAGNPPLEGWMDRYNLTAREMEILSLIFANQSTREIAATLQISPETVRKHMQNIYQKTGAHSKMGLLLLYNNS